MLACACSISHCKSRRKQVCLVAVHMLGQASKLFTILKGVAQRPSSGRQLRRGQGLRLQSVSSSHSLQSTPPPHERRGAGRSQVPTYTKYGHDSSTTQKKIYVCHRRLQRHGKLARYQESVSIHLQNMRCCFLNVSITFVSLLDHSDTACLRTQSRPNLPIGCTAGRIPRTHCMGRHQKYRCNLSHVWSQSAHHRLTPRWRKECHKFLVILKPLFYT